MEQLLNFYQSTPLIGTSGQPAAEQFAQIAESGYEVVINLAMPNSDNAVANEGQLVTTAGMLYCHLPVPFESPDAEHVGQFFKLLQAFSGRKVLVHCAINARVSAFMFKYLTLVHGLAPEQARSPLLQRWLPQMEPVWQDIIELTLDDIES